MPKELSASLILKYTETVSYVQYNTVLPQVLLWRDFSVKEVQCYTKATDARFEKLLLMYFNKQLDDLVIG